MIGVKRISTIFQSVKVCVLNSSFLFDIKVIDSFILFFIESVFTVLLKCCRM